LVRGQGEVVTFTVTDGNAEVPVRFAGVLPDLFDEGQGMIGTGSMEGDTFVATEILAKHDESYMPKEVVDALKEQGVYVDPKAKPAS
jgi:cytochrome c-type biogenesis protein CcmE